MNQTIVDNYNDTNILANFKDLKSLIQPNLGKFKCCQKQGLDLLKVDLGGICTGIELLCETCYILEH